MPGAAQMIYKCWEDEQDWLLSQIYWRSIDNVLVQTGELGKHYQIGNAIQYDWGMPLLGICVWEILTCVYCNASARISTTILFVATENWQPWI